MDAGFAVSSPYDERNFWFGCWLDLNGGGRG